MRLSFVDYFYNDTREKREREKMNFSKCVFYVHENVRQAEVVSLECEKIFSLICSSTLTFECCVERYILQSGNYYPDILQLEYFDFMTEEHKEVRTVIALVRYFDKINMVRWSYQETFVINV